MSSRGFASSYRIVLLAAAVFTAFGAVGTRLVFLHVIDRDKLVTDAEDRRRRVVEIPARRGDILDCRGNLLATTQTELVVGVDPESLTDEDRAHLPEVAALLHLDPAAVEAACQRRTRQVRVDRDDPDSATREEPVRWSKLAEGVDESTYDKLDELKLKAIYGSRDFARVYPQHDLASQIVGYVNKVGDPMMGAEAYLDFYLSGREGWREGEVDGRRRELAQYRTREVPAADGYDVVLSIDNVIQHMVERELHTIADTFHPAKATIIVSDPRTGMVLGLGNYPTFDLDDYGASPIAAQKNMAVTDMVEPGSTFKIVTISAAIDQGIVTPQTVIDTSEMVVDYKGLRRRFMPDDHPFHEPPTVADVIARSSNVGTGHVALMIGEQKLYDYARAFGFGETSGFPFGGEIRGSLRPPSEWTAPDITRIPAGYAVAATPMQIHYAMATLANGGVLLRPQIVSEIRTSAGDVVYRFGAQERRRVVSERTAATMAQMLERVASSEGTAVEAAIPGFQVAGKTGTAQKIVDGHYSNRNHVGSFVGFFPATRPRVVISVIVDDGHPPSGLPAYGRVVAAPSFKRIGEQLIQYLDIRPVEPEPGVSLAMRP